jgi:hypothetical protein
MRHLLPGVNRFLSLRFKKPPSGPALFSPRRAVLRQGSNYSKAVDQRARDGETIFCTFQSIDKR